MITKKLAVPLINEKILQQAEHCYIATSAITEGGFDFIRTRVSPKCRIDIVTSLDRLSSASAMQKILRHYQGRINLNIYTRNMLNANLYVFDLPFRKSVAFVGSGSLSVEGLKDNEELFWKITDAKQVESLMSWYTSYFQFSVPLSDTMAEEYERLYPGMKKREILSMKEKQEMIRLASFSLDAIKFRGQFFLKEDYETMSLANAFADNASLRISRAAVAEKVAKLHGMLNSFSAKAGLISEDQMGRSVDPRDHANGKLNSMFLTYRKEADSVVSYEVGVSSMDVFIRAVVTNETQMKKAREVWRQRLESESVSSSWWDSVVKLSGFTMEVAGIEKPLESFKDKNQVIELLRTDHGDDFEVVFCKRITPGDPLVSAANIVETASRELTLLKQTAWL